VDWLVVDHYAFDARWHDAIRQAVGCRIAVIDDLADRPIDADLLVDPNWNADHFERYRPVLQRPTDSLFGPRFALLDPAYADAPKYRFQPGVRSIGIFMGGTDPGNATEAALAACRAAGFAGPIELVSTEANPHLHRLRSLCAGTAGTTLSVGLPDLASFFARHDLQIGAGGGATWERCCIGAPTLAVVLAPNQLATIPALEQLGALRWSRSMEPAAWSAYIARLLAAPEEREHLVRAARGLVDGLGASRVALRMLRDSLAVRPATLDDAAMVFAWRNDPATRSTSTDPAPLEYAAHEAWMRATLADSGRHLLIAMVGSQPVGVIRFDLAPGPIATVSLYLAPPWPGLGLGSRMLASGENFLAARIRGKCSLQARVLPGNDVSRRMFEGAGYTGGPEAYTKWLAPAQPATP
jgi:UDP-2,4-diacetamido-2,4,6-trideoxy-beta-L-altropyranose hydrolase